MQRRQFHIAALGAACATLASRLTDAAEIVSGPDGFPSHPMRVVVPYPAGGVVDAVIRAVVGPISNDLPQTIFTENRPGADGRIGVDAVAKATPDGYTLLAATPILAVGEHLMPEMKGSAKEFAGICCIAAPPSVYIVTAGLPVHTLADFITLARSKPGALNVANPGIGSSLQLGQELLFERTGIKLTNINYKGQPQSLIDIAAGQVHFALISQNLALPLLQNGKARALAVNASSRTRSLPNVPTIAEAGFADALVQSWYGIAAPIRTPAAIVNYLSQQFQRAMGKPEVLANLKAMDADIMALDGRHFDALIASEYRRWGELIRKRNITMG